MLLDLRIIISINYKCVVYACPYIDEDLGGKCLLKHIDIVTNALKQPFTPGICTLHVYTVDIQNIKKNP